MFEDMTIEEELMDFSISETNFRIISQGLGPEGPKAEEL